MNPIDPLGRGRIEPARSGKTPPLEATGASEVARPERIRDLVGSDVVAARAIDSTQRSAAIESEIHRSFGSVLPPDSMAAILAAVERNPGAQRLLDRAIAATADPSPPSSAG